MKNTSTSSAKSKLLFLLSVYVSSFTFGFLNISGKVYQDIPKIEINRFMIMIGLYLQQKGPFTPINKSVLRINPDNYRLEEQ